MRVGPSLHREAWHRFLFEADTWRPQELRALIEADEPGAAAFEIETFVNGAYRARARGVGRPDTPARARWVQVNSRFLYDELGPARRDVHLGLLRWIKRASCLGPVLGAGATMAAGGPSWPALVGRLLDRALERGHARARRVEVDAPDDGEAGGEPDRRVMEVVRLDDAAEARAREIRRAIDGGTATVEELQEGAQLCRDLFGQHLYGWATAILYENDREPSEIHRALAELADPQFVFDRGGEFSGWSDIVTYNFDDFMGIALDERGVARAAWAMRGDALAGDPNEAAVQAGPDGVFQSILHLHGYTPHKLFRITHVRFVFAASEYLDSYEESPAPIFEAVRQRLLHQPVFVALYVGCSFTDERMNEMLVAARDAFPGRYHYALLPWPGDGPYAEARREELDLHGAAFERMGIRPLWFDGFDEIPALIRDLGGPPGGPVDNPVGGSADG